MLEVYNLPTANTVTASVKLLRKNTLTPALSLQKVVCWDELNQVDNGFAGRIRKVQISTTELNTQDLRNNDLLMIHEQEYKLMNVILYQNPGFVDFYECDIKEV